MIKGLHEVVRLWSSAENKCRKLEHRDDFPTQLQVASFGMGTFKLGEKIEHNASMKDVDVLSCFLPEHCYRSQDELIIRP